MPMGGINDFIIETMNRPHTTQIESRQRNQKKKNVTDKKKGGRGSKKDSSSKRESQTAATPGSRDIAPKPESIEEKPVEEE